MNLSVPAAGDVFSGAVEGQGGGGVSTIGTRPMRSLSSTIGRTRSERAVKKAALGFRVFGFAFCLISFLVMAADVKKGWALDSFHRYVEFSFVFIQPKRSDYVNSLCPGSSNLRPSGPSRRWSLQNLCKIAGAC